MTYRRRALASYVKKVTLNIAERKYVDTLVGNFSLGTYAAPLVLSMLNGILIGATADATSRIGNKIYVRGIVVQAQMYGQATMISSGSLCRLLVVHNKEGAKSLLPYSELFANNLMPAPRATPYMHKYRILLDKVHALTPTGLNGANVLSGPIAAMNVYIPINKVIEYVDSTPTAGTTSYGAPVSVNVSNTLLAVNNMLKDDIQIMCFAADNTCCNMTLSWKVIFSDS